MRYRIEKTYYGKYIVKRGSFFGLCWDTWQWLTPWQEWYTYTFDTPEEAERSFLACHTKKPENEIIKTVIK